MDAIFPLFSVLGQKISTIIFVPEHNFISSDPRHMYRFTSTYTELNIFTLKGFVVIIVASSVLTPNPVFLPNLIKLFLYLDQTEFIRMK